MVAPEEGSPSETALAPIGEKNEAVFPPRLCNRPRARGACEASIRKIVLGAWLASLTATISVARAAEPEPAPAGLPTHAAGPVRVERAPGLDLPPQIASDLRAAIDDAIAGRAQPDVPIDVTLEAGGVVVRVGTLWRRLRSPGGITRP